MSERPAVPSFQPSAEWSEDWPYGVSTLVRAQASVTGPAAAHGMQRFLEPLTHSPEAEVPDGVSLYFQGGFFVEVEPPADEGAWQIMVASAGEDGFGSLMTAADDLVAALRATPGEVRLSWRELPATTAERWRSSRARTITIDSEHAGRRLDKFLRSRLKGVPAGLLFRLLRQGKLRVNGRKTQQNYRLHDGDVINVPPLQIDAVAAPQGSVPSALIDQLRGAVLHEDDDLLIINKPAGMAVHKGTDVPAGVIEALRQLRPDVPELELSHRLDRDTSGVLAVAKSPTMLRYLHTLLRDREDEIERRYLAIVAGSWPSELRILDAPLLREDARVVVDAGGQRAETHVCVQQRIGDRATLLNVRLLTGRKHQIRVHLQHAGHPIIGDDRYGDENVNRHLAGPSGAGLYLHAETMVIPRPDGTELVVTAPMPEQWGQLLRTD